MSQRQREFSIRPYLRPKILGLVFGFVICTLAFNNCGRVEPLSELQGVSSGGNSNSPSRSESGNGGVYGGLQRPIVPSVVQPGQKVSIVVVGGVGPFKVKILEQLGSVSQRSEREFEWVVASGTGGQNAVVTVEDSVNDRISVDVLIQVITPQESAVGKHSFGYSLTRLRDLLVVSAPDKGLIESKTEAVYFYRQPMAGALTYSQEVSDSQQGTTQFGYTVRSDQNKLIVSSSILAPDPADGLVRNFPEARVYRYNSQGQVEEEARLRAKIPSGSLIAGAEIENDLAIVFSSGNGARGGVNVFRNRGLAEWAHEEVLNAPASAGIVGFVDPGIIDAKVNRGQVLIVAHGGTVETAYRKADLRDKTAKNLDFWFYTPVLFNVFSRESASGWGLKVQIDPLRDLVNPSGDATDELVKYEVVSHSIVNNQLLVLLRHRQTFKNQLMIYDQLDTNPRLASVMRLDQFGIDSIKQSVKIAVNDRYLVLAAIAGGAQRALVFTKSGGSWVLSFQLDLPAKMVDSKTIASILLMDNKLAVADYLGQKILIYKLDGI